MKQMRANLAVPIELPSNTLSVRESCRNIFRDISEHCHRAPWKRSNKPCCATRRSSRRLWIRMFGTAGSAPSTCSSCRWHRLSPARRADHRTAEFKKTEGAVACCYLQNRVQVARATRFRGSCCRRPQIFRNMGSLAKAISSTPYFLGMTILQDVRRRPQHHHGA